MHPKVSIIIPVYNTSQYLERCLKSVLDQDLEEIEIFVIDDASTDNSIKILESFVKRDERIILKKFETNQGQAAARNWGIKQAKSDYILFVDSDDFLQPNVLRELYNKAYLENLDILEARHYRLKVEKKEEFPPKFKLMSQILTGDKYLKETNNISVMVWNKLWKRSFLIENDILFKKRNFEDEDFVVRAFMQAKRVKNIGNFLYNYLIRQNSTMRSEVTLGKVKDYVALTQELDRLYSKADTVEMKQAIQKLLNHNFLGGPEYFRNKDNKQVKSSFSTFKIIFSKYRWNILTCKRTNIGLRILIFLDPFLANLIYRKWRLK